ncbi:MAG: hypothetical protein ACRDLQ_06045 [Solirubrobacterales bacterium]
MRLILAILAVLVIALVATQILLPRMGESQVEDRLTRDGGTADVTIEAVPAVRLLFDDGDKLVVRGREVNIPVTDLRGGSFKELDGFDEVDVRLGLSNIGPFFAERVTIARGKGEELYAFAYRGSTSAAEVGDFALSGLPPLLRSALTALAGRAGSQELPIRLDVNLRSDNGRARVVGGTGTFAGLPLSGFALGIAGAIISRITG